MTHENFVYESLDDAAAAVRNAGVAILIVGIILALASTVLMCSHSYDIEDVLIPGISGLVVGFMLALIGSAVKSKAVKYEYLKLQMIQNGYTLSEKQKKDLDDLLKDPVMQHYPIYQASEENSEK